jgi:hypothetical protein
VTHEDCSAVSIHLGTILDVEDFIHASYTWKYRRLVSQEACINAPTSNASRAATRS